jgi:3-oxoacyl-[acyl-carrier protein] reductase
MSAPSRPVVLITGGSRGLGRAIAEHVAMAGASVAINFRQDSASADATLASLGHGGHHAAFQADVTVPEECERLVHAVLERFGRIDALVNNAGILTKANIGAPTYDEFVRSHHVVFEANATSVANITFLVARQMATQEPMADGCRGRIVNLTSRSAYQGSAAGFSSYAASKAAVGLLGQTLAVTFGPRGIAFFGIAPTFIETDMVAPFWESIKDTVIAQHPIGRLPTADEVGRIGQWLAMSAPLPMTGTIIDVNGASHIHH